MSLVVYKYDTHYHLLCGENRALFGSYLYAHSIEEALALCIRRGLDEKLCIGFSDPMPLAVSAPSSIRVLMPADPGFTHWICFLGFIALKAGYTAEELFGDAGVLHELVHLGYGIMLANPIATQELVERYHSLCRALGFLPGKDGADGGS